MRRRVVDVHAFVREKPKATLALERLHVALAEAIVIQFALVKAVTA
jgi:hypothetical protein